MQVFGVFTYWKKNNPTSLLYPTYEETVNCGPDAPQPMLDWKEAMVPLAEAIYKEPVYLFYNRLDLPDSNVVTMTYYTSYEDYQAVRASLLSQFELMEMARYSLAEYLDNTMYQVEQTFELEAFDYEDVDSTFAFVQDLIDKQVIS